MNETNDQVDGIDVSNVTDWLAERRPVVAPPLTFDLITGGHSNLTYRVTDAAGTRWVLRRPPLAHVLEGAHDMVREHRLLDALGPTGVPVPAVVGLCTDAAVTGADFYVTDFVEGRVLRTPAESEALTAEGLGRLGDELVGNLAAIHAVDLDATGLADLGRREDYVARQLRTWKRAFEAMTSRHIPGVAEVHDRLAAAIPPQREATLVHGDFRLDNCLVADDGAVAAVLDWEIATLGDPMADLGITLAYWSEPGDAFMPLGDSATVAPGMASRADLVDAYGRVTGRDTSDVPYFHAFACWRLACILEGVYSRYIGGASPEVPAEVEVFARSVVDLVGLADKLLDEA